MTSIENNIEDQIKTLNRGILYELLSEYAWFPGLGKTNKNEIKFVPNNNRRLDKDLPNEGSVKRIIKKILNLYATLKQITPNQYILINKKPVIDRCVDYVKSFYSRSLHRELLENEIGRIAGSVKGMVLDIGSKNRRYDDAFYNADKIVAIDKNPVAGKDIIQADAVQMPFQSASFDTIVSFEVMEYIMETELVLKEVKRVITRDGTVIFSAPFLNPVHGDVDLVRYTYKGWAMLLEKHFSIIDLRSFGGTFSIIWDFYFERVRNSYGRVAKVLLFPILLVTKHAVIYLDQREKNNRFMMGYFVICKPRQE